MKPARSLMEKGKVWLKGFFTKYREHEIIASSHPHQQPITPLSTPPAMFLKGVNDIAQFNHIHERILSNAAVVYGASSRILNNGYTIVTSHDQFDKQYQAALVQHRPRRNHTTEGVVLIKSAHKDSLFDAMKDLLKSIGSDVKSCLEKTEEGEPICDVKDSTKEIEQGISVREQVESAAGEGAQGNPRICPTTIFSSPQNFELPLPSSSSLPLRPDASPRVFHTGTYFPGKHVLPSRNSTRAYPRGANQPPFPPYHTS
ncbi:hypothetical protein GQ43DRAFT_436089 [Delitschia confertaspora ATCC 74209]|uniref:Uncharacterized protein n=1 Tax=Delitschia confertaspora ATCC 74209 TaxID=1513339 RepID=A0A9P4JDL1_9PLEO|nr:hypothetical protein GQ43DRAFT_436089 [Delitschia confertaspora ATCC 74209]